MRIVLAGVLGGIAMFVWMSIAHMATPLAYAGISKIDNEAAVSTALTKAIPKSGLFFFPWADPKDPDAMKKQDALRKTGPSGILIYHPPGHVIAMGPLLLHEFLKELAQSLIAAFLLSLTVLASYFARAGFVTLIGVFAALGADTSYFIWYGFPLSYTLAQIVIEVVGALAAGLVIAAVMKPRRA